MSHWSQQKGDDRHAGPLWVSSGTSGQVYLNVAFRAQSESWALPQTSQSLTQQNRLGESSQKRSEPSNIGILIPEERVVMGAANRQ
ncbi:MAG: hypothetical protein OES26_23975, partial [Gammaproteobacteria bacterium]|nr:hypothetical protein [Gammaproteobacteria bacterium]